MPARLAHVAQEDSRLPATADTVGSLTRVVHELSVRIARRWPLVLYSARHQPSDQAEEERDGIRHVRFSAGADRTFVAEWFRWRNRLGRRLGLPEAPYPGSRAYYWTYIRRVARHLAGVRPALVHLHNVSQFVPPLRRATPEARLVLQMHCEWLVELPPSLVLPRLGQVDLVLGVSEHIVHQVRTAYPEVADRCRVLHNGVDPERFPPRERTLAERRPAVEELRARFRLGSPVVLYVGRLSSEKGVHVLLQAFGRLRERWPAASCVLVGPDWGPLRRVRTPDADAGLDHDYVGRLRRLAAPHGDRVVFAGAVPNEHLALHYALADVVAAPSLLEAFGIPAVEAGATGVPVVGSAVGGLVDTVVPGTTGLLVPPGDPGALADALAAVAADPARARAFGDAARERVASAFTWDRIATTLAGYYEELLATPAAGRAA
ncbi:MAG TPA: glycosyltransferase family 4 protein [Candidatus Binatia bacterium]|nr:glycosyltransferase family 4 protein [Candidatus Binatia bacterium]